MPGYRLSSTCAHCRCSNKCQERSRAIFFVCSFTKSLVSEGRLHLLHMESCVSLSLCHRSTVCLWVVSVSRSLQGSRCSVTCEDGQFFNGHDCQPCHRFCAACAGTVSYVPPLFSSLWLWFFLTLAIFHVTLNMFQVNVEGHMSPDNCAPILTKSQSAAPCPHGET